MGGATETKAKQDFMMESEVFEPVVLQLCGESADNLSDARKMISELISKEHINSTIQDSAINFFSHKEVEVMRELQKELAISIYSSKTGPEPEIVLEGLTRDVMKAESHIRNMIRKAEKQIVRQRGAIALSSQVTWLYEDLSKNLVPFDILTNYDLEEANKIQTSVEITINNKQFTAFAHQNFAVGRSSQITLKRTVTTVPTGKIRHLNS